MRVIILALEEEPASSTDQAVARALERGDRLFDWTGIDGTLTIRRDGDVARIRLKGQREHLQLATAIPVAAA